jgi:hypothetical protein
MSCIFGENRDIYFPKLSENLHLISFADIAVKYLKAKGYEPYLCKDEDEARKVVKTLIKDGKYPCLFTPSDTTGEKDFEEFFTDEEILDIDKFENLGIIKNDVNFNEELLQNFENNIYQMKQNLFWDKEKILKEFFTLIPDFGHKKLVNILMRKCKCKI